MQAYGMDLVLATPLSKWLLQARHVRHLQMRARMLRSVSVHRLSTGRWERLDPPSVPCRSCAKLPIPSTAGSTVSTGS